MAFWSSGQFSLHGPDKSRHCTITSHKSVSVSHCAERMNYWTADGERDIHTYIHTCAQARLRVRSHIPVRNPVLGVWIMRGVREWRRVMPFYTCCCFRLHQERKQHRTFKTLHGYLSQRLTVCLTWRNYCSDLDPNDFSLSSIYHLKVAILYLIYIPFWNIFLNQ